MFRIKPSGTSDLRVLLNDDSVSFSVGSGNDHSVHLVFSDTENLKRTGNELVVGITRARAWEGVRISDIVIFFQAEIGLVVGP
jgi:hypothetical protein